MITWPLGHIVYPLLFLVLAAANAKASENMIIGSPNADVLSDTPDPDVFYGGLGADRYIKQYLHSQPDLIVDFNPEEGDEIELRFQNPRPDPLTLDQLSINRKGVVSWRLMDGKQLPLFGINRSDLKVELDRRNGSVFLKFKADL